MNLVSSAAIKFKITRYSHDIVTGNRHRFASITRFNFCDLVSMLAAVHPTPNLRINAGAISSVVNGPFRCDPPLHVVAQLGCVDVGECLLSNGADVNLVSAITAAALLIKCIS